jgi:ABC-type multidrug transport system ATPase subunit
MTDERQPAPADAPGRKHSRGWSLRECSLGSPASGKRPRLLLLDEPLAREAVLATLVTECLAQGITVLLSSHVLAQLEGVCDHLVLLGKGRVQLAGDSTEAAA